MSPMRDTQTNEQLKIELLSQWKVEAKSRKIFQNLKPSKNLKIFQKSENLLKICLIKYLKGHKSLGSLCNVVKGLIVSLVRATNQPTKGRTMSPIELFWTAKNFRSSGFQISKIF